MERESEISLTRQLGGKLPVNNVGESKHINELPPEVFQCILLKLSTQTKLHNLIRLRSIDKHWKDNIDSFLWAQQSIYYRGIIRNGIPLRLDFDRFIKSIGKYRSIKSLSMEDYLLSDRFGEIISKTMPELRILKMKNCPGIDWRGFSKIGVALENIQIIDFQNCRLNESHINILVGLLKKLRLFKVLDCHQVVDGIFMKDFGPNIEDIWISLIETPDINEALQALYQGNGKNVIHLGIVVSNIHQINLVELANNLKRLESIRLTFISHHEDHLNGITLLTSLRNLTLVETTENNFESVITDQTLITILNECKNIEQLALASMERNTIRVSNRSLLLIPRLLPNIQVIKFVNVHNVDNRTLEEFANLRKLRKLYINHNNNIDMDGFKHLIKFESLKEIHILGCSNVDDKIIPVLKELALKRKNQMLSFYIDGINFNDNIEINVKNLKIYYK